jgi:hypothetical protein
MDYEPELSEKAERYLSSLEPSLRARLAASLLSLGKEPSKFSRPVAVPSLNFAGMAARFAHEASDGTMHRIEVLFQYSQDETKLLVYAIGDTLTDVDSR